MSRAFWESVLDVSIMVFLAGATLLALVSAMAGCTPASRDAQMRALNIATIATNEVESGIVLAYRYRMQKCLEDSYTRIDFDVCAAEVDHEYTKVRLIWDSLRSAQDKYATALEHGFHTIDEFKEWFRSSYCNLVAGLPIDVRVLPPSGFSCDARSTSNAE